MAEGEVFKATIIMGDKSITFEGPKDFVEEQVARYTGLLPSKHQAIEQRSIANQSTIVREDDLIQAKRPQGHSEIIAVLAYHLAESGMAEFSDEDMRRAYITSGSAPSKNSSTGAKGREEPL